MIPPNKPGEENTVMSGDEKLDTVNNYNYLGVIIDDRLTFEKILKAKGNKVNSRLYKM